MQASDPVRPRQLRPNQQAPHLWAVAAAGFFFVGFVGLAAMRLAVGLGLPAAFLF